jgi:hypothetical protein
VYSRLQGTTTMIQRLQAIQKTPRRLGREPNAPFVAGRFLLQFLGATTEEFSESPRARRARSGKAQMGSNTKSGWLR